MELQNFNCSSVHSVTPYTRNFNFRKVPSYANLEVQKVLKLKVPKLEGSETKKIGKSKGYKFEESTTCSVENS